MDEKYAFERTTKNFSPQRSHNSPELKTAGKLFLKPASDLFCCSQLPLFHILPPILTLHNLFQKQFSDAFSSLSQVISVTSQEEQKQIGVQESYYGCLYLFANQRTSRYFPHSLSVEIGHESAKGKWNLTLQQISAGSGFLWWKHGLGDKYATICLAKDNASCREKKGKNTFPGWEVSSHLYLGSRQC